LLLGILVLVWLPFEESSVLGVLVIAGLFCTWGGIWVLFKTGSYRKHGIVRNVLIWGLAGFFVVPITILLMAIKTGIHGHGTPDFSVEQMQAVLSRIPYFMFGGVLVGAGIGLLRTVNRERAREAR
jgi:hypothetical protein